MEKVPCSIKVRSVYPSMTKSEKAVADYVLAAPEAVLDRSLLDLSRDIKVSEASVIRFCRRLGYSGFNELKLQVAIELGEGKKNSYELDRGLDMFENSGLSDIPRLIIDRSIRGLKDTMKIFDDKEYQRAVEALRQAGKVALYGIGNSASVADDAQKKFMRIGVNCSVFGDGHMQIMSAVNLGQGDVAIGISHSGRTKDIIQALKLAKKAGATTICITNYEASFISEVSDIMLLTAAGLENSFDSETMASRIAQLAIIDMLYLGIILDDYKGYRKKLADIDSMMRDKAF